MEVSIKSTNNDTQWFCFQSGCTRGFAKHHAGICICFLQKDEVYLNLVLEFVPETVYRVARHYSKNKQTLAPLLIKVSYCCMLCVLVNVLHDSILIVRDQKIDSAHDTIDLCFELRR
jgi:hypothetical protein